MKILFIDPEIFSSEKFLKFISKDNIEGDINNRSSLVDLRDSPYTVEDLLKVLDVNKEIMDEIKKISSDKLIVIPSNIKSLEKLNSQLIFDFKKSGSLKYKNFTINFDEEGIYVDNKRIRLTDLEYNLLLIFIYNPKKLIPKQSIIEYLWSQRGKHPVSEGTIYTHIKNLKKKINRTGGNDFIHTIYGQGYKFEDPEEVYI